MLQKHKQFYYVGPPAKAGPLPALFYFALSAEATLTMDPFNQILSFLPLDKLRVFSCTLPLHDCPPQEFNHRVLEWKNKMLLSFFDSIKEEIEELIEKNIIEEKKIAVAGLSRGAFIAAHMAARIPQIKILLGFAPLTKPTFLEDDSLYLNHLVSDLIHKNVRFYIGNRDRRVGTENAFEFIQMLANANYEANVRPCQVELYIQPSHGHLGHGTLPQTFKEGAYWINALLHHHTH